MTGTLAKACLLASPDGSVTSSDVVVDRPGELVAAPGDRGHEVVAERLAQGRDLDLDVRLLDVQPGPDELEEFRLRDDPITALDQHLQNVEGARSQGHWPAVEMQLAFDPPKLEAIEPEAPRHRSTPDRRSRGGERSRRRSIEIMHPRQPRLPPNC